MNPDTTLNRRAQTFERTGLGLGTPLTGVSPAMFSCRGSLPAQRQMGVSRPMSLIGTGWEPPRWASHLLLPP